MFVSGYMIGINNNINCTSLLNVGSCARVSSCGWVKFYMVCFQVGCVMLCKDGDNLGALPLEVARAWASRKNISFLIGLDIIKALQGSRTRYYQGSIKFPKQDLNHMKVLETSTILY